MNGDKNTLIAPTFGAQPATTARQTPSATSYNVPLGYLRAFITMLVVAHHAVLAYHPFAPPPPASLVTQPRLWQAFPIVDAHRSTIFALFTGFNDTYFMSLMFLLSGLFVWQSLQRKGSVGFVRDRLMRLGVPFLIATVLLSPVAYFPAYLQTASHRSLAGFWQQWRSLGQWPSGPAWFLWVLLAFDCVAATLYALQPKWGEVLSARVSTMLRRPLLCFGALLGCSAIAYVPMALKFTALYWTSIGPLTFQTSRIFHYLVYFLAGIMLGARGLDRTFLQTHEALARRWIAWPMAAVGAFAIATIVVIVAFSQPNNHRTWELLGGVAFVLSCAASSFAFLSLFLRFAGKPRKVYDSLCQNAYGVYLLHYLFVNWAQYALLQFALSALTKGAIVFSVAMLLSWGLTSVLRRSRQIAKFV
jgi:peptidoglycan/LPS O-acetylase OafA/YrhL